MKTRARRCFESNVERQLECGDTRFFSTELMIDSRLQTKASDNAFRTTYFQQMSSNKFYNPRKVVEATIVQPRSKDKGKTTIGANGEPSDTAIAYCLER